VARCLADRGRNLPRETPLPDVAPESAEVLRGLATTLGVDEEFVQPVYEDAVEWIVREAQLPDNLSPDDPKLDDPEERARSMRTFQRGLNKPVGYVLPIQRWWQAAQMPIRAGVRKSGVCGAGRCLRCRATRRWAIACRWLRCPM
jgi:uncharacterized protein (DUF2126 family)